MNNPTTILPKKETTIKTSELMEDQKRSISKEIETVVRNFLRDITYESEVAIRANVDGYVMAGDGKIMFTDYPSFKEYVKQAFTGIQKFIEPNVPALHVYVLSNDVASCTFDLRSKYLTTEGETIIHNACWTLVFKKFDDGWKVVQENGTHTH
ncbi:MAG: nuclear transport factor 2 family protein [Flavisolibacter sp.]